MTANELWAKIEILIKQFEAYCTVMDTISVHEDFQLWKTLQARKIAIVEEKRALGEKWKEAVYAERLAKTVTLSDVQPEQSVTSDVCEGEMGTVGNIGQVGVQVSWRQEIVESEVQKDGAVYKAANGWYVTPSHNCFFDWFVYRDDGCLFTFAVTLEAAKRLADEGRETR